MYVIGEIRNYVAYTIWGLILILAQVTAVIYARILREGVENLKREMAKEGKSTRRRSSLLVSLKKYMRRNSGENLGWHRGEDERKRGAYAEKKFFVQRLRTMVCLMLVNAASQSPQFIVVLTKYETRATEGIRLMHRMARLVSLASPIFIAVTILSFDPALNYMRWFRSQQANLPTQGRLKKMITSGQGGCISWAKKTGAATTREETEGIEQVESGSRKRNMLEPINENIGRRLEEVGRSYLPTLEDEEHKEILVFDSPNALGSRENKVIRFECPPHSQSDYKVRTTLTTSTVSKSKPIIKDKSPLVEIPIDYMSKKRNNREIQERQGANLFSPAKKNSKPRIDTFGSSDSSEQKII